MLVFAGRSRRLGVVAFSPDGRELAAAGDSPGGPGRASDSGVEVWDLFAGPAAPQLLFPDRKASALWYDPGGRWLLAGGHWSANGAPAPGTEAVDRAEPGPPVPVSGGLPAGAGPGGLLAVGDAVVESVLGWVRRAGWVACLGVAGGPPFPAVWRVDYAVGEFVAAATVLPDGRAVTLDSRRSEGAYTFRVRAAGTGAAVASAPVSNRTPGPLTASPDGGLVVMNAGGSLYVWRTADPAAPPRKVVFGRKHCTGLAFHPSGDYLLAAGNDGSVRRLSLPDWRTTATYAWQHGKARSVAVSPDGLLAAAGTDTGKVVVWDLD